MKKAYYALFLVLMIGCKAKDSQEIDLKLNLNKGDQFTVVTEVVTGKNATMAYTQYNEIKFTVDSVLNGSYRLKANLQRTKSEMKMDGTVDGYDSQKSEASMTKDEKEIHDQYKMALANAVNITMNSNASVTEPITYSNGMAVPEEIIDLKYITLHYPSTKVKTGSTWEREETNKFTTVKLKWVYTVREITEKEIHLFVNMTMKGAAGMINNEGEGKYVIDRKTGRAIKADINMSLKSQGSLLITVREK